jgi:hypothetical protein
MVHSVGERQNMNGSPPLERVVMRRGKRTCVALCATTFGKGRNVLKVEAGVPIDSI